MPTRIIIPDRIAQGIKIAVVRLNIPRIGHERIWREEGADLGIIVAGVVVVETRVIDILAGVLKT